MADTNPNAPEAPQDDAHRNNPVGRELYQIGKILGIVIWVRGFPLGIIFSLAVGFLGWILGAVIGKVLESLLFDMDIFGLTPQGVLGMYLGVIASVGFFIAGIYTVRIAHGALPAFLGIRLKGVTFDEGINWWLPPPLGILIEESFQGFPLDLESTEVLAADGIVVTVDASLEHKIVNLYRYLNANKPIQQLTNEALDQLRYVVGKRPSTALYQNGTTTAQAVASQRKELSHEWLEGGRQENTGTEPSGDDRGLQKEAEHLGMAITKVQISNIRLPAAVEEANERKTVEIAQRQAEETEVDTVIALSQKLVDADATGELTLEKAINFLQTERGKTQRILIEGGASDLVKAGALAGGIVGPSDGSSSDKQHGNAPLAQRRRRSNR